MLGISICTLKHLSKHNILSLPIRPVRYCFNPFREEICGGFKLSNTVYFDIANFEIYYSFMKGEESCPKLYFVSNTCAIWNSHAGGNF